MKRPLIDRISDLHLLTRIVACGSLSAAARESGISLPVVSARLAAMEETIGVRLLHRSTRHLCLTAEGEEFHARAQRILAEAWALEESVAGGIGNVTGRLRVTATAAFARRHIAPRIGAFRARYPGVTIDLLAGDSVLDIVRGGIDVAIRQSSLDDSGLTVRKLVENRRVACASPDYVERHGLPAGPDDLARHDCIVIGEPPMTRWPFEHRANGRTLTVAVEPIFQSNDGDAAHAAALAGAGIVLKSHIDVCDDLAAGHLVDMLPDWVSPSVPLQAVYPGGRQAAAKVGAFLDFLSEDLVAKMRAVEHGEPS